MKERILFFSLFILVSYFLVNMQNNTYSYSYDIDKSVLFYDSDNNKLENNIKEYIGLVDDYIIPNSTFEFSYYLNENYDFLVYFAMDYVLGNFEYYSDLVSIIDGEKYINVEDIYAITDKYFGVRDFYIFGDIFNIKNEYIQLVDYNMLNFNLSIIDVDIVNRDSELGAVILYENNLKYLYLFDNINGVLKIKNIEVLE